MKNGYGLQLLSLSGLTEDSYAAIYQLLDRDEVAMIDAHQGTVYTCHTLNLLLDIPEQHAMWWKEQLVLLREHAKSHNVGLAVTAVRDTEYDAWLRHRGKPHYIMTVLADGLPTKALVAIELVLRRHNMRIEGMQRLSGYTTPNRDNTKKRAIFALELMLRGQCADEATLRTELLVTGQELNINLGLQRDNIYRRHRRLLAMDMDSTLIKIEIIDELARIIGADTAHQVAELTRRTMDGELNFEQSLKKRVRLLAGMRQATLEQVANKLPLSEGATVLFTQLKKLGYHTAIISGGFDFFAHALQSRLGIDTVHANCLEIRNGALTGYLQGPIIDGEGKAERLRALALDLGIAMEQSIAVGDGANDIPMLSAAGLSIAFHPRPMLLRSASHSFTRMGLDGILYLIGLRSV